MKLLENIKSKIPKDENVENAPHVEITEAALDPYNTLTMTINKIQDRNPVITCPK